MDRLRRTSEIDAVWFGVVALGLAIHGQRILTPGSRPAVGADVGAAARWYALAIAVLLLGWWGTYRNLSLIHRPVHAATGIRERWLSPAYRWRLVTIGVAVLANILAILILRGNWSSWPGGLLWVGSVGLLTGSCWREPSTVSAGAVPVTPERRFSWRLPWRVEVAVVLAIMVLALLMRLWRLGDLTPGMHGDEGEAGTQALNILAGRPVSPFMRGWFNQSNVYYWTIAVVMRVFGTGLFGLRILMVLCGLVTVLFVYRLAREMFGQRAAIIAGFFIAFQSADLLFSREEFSNGTVPPLMTIAAYFIVRGFRTRRHLDFAVSGLASGWALYYFAGGRLVVLVILAFLAFVALRHPYLIAGYWTRGVAFLLAFLAISSPYIAYFIAYPILGLQYPNDRFIWLHHDDLAAQYGSYDWSVILWGQLTRTLAIITHGVDISAMGALDFPIARPLEASLIVLGMAWAAWRWRDTRFALLSLWFWSWIVAGGVLTTEAPNLPRIMGMLPVLPIIIAAVLDHLATQIAATTAKVGRGAARLIAKRWRRGGQALGGLVAGSAIVFSGVQNWQMYIGYYLTTHQNPVVTGQAAYVQRKGLRYYFYGMGSPIIYWNHGDNRFINPYAEGVDAANASNYLPIVDNGANGEKDVNFLVWPPMYDYLHVLQTYYPEGRIETVNLGDAGQQIEPLYGYVVTHQQIDKHRVLHARYVPAAGRAITRLESSIGLAGRAAPPTGLQYPVHAAWDGGLVAPSYDIYRFRLTAPSGTELTIDGVRVARVGPAGYAAAKFLLARGPHSVHVAAILHSARTRVDLRWQSSTRPLQHIARRYLWDNHVGRSWLSEVDLEAQLTPNLPLLRMQVFRRVDGFLGLRNTGWAVYPTSQLTARWTSILHVSRPGQYSFDLNSNGDSMLLIDGHVVVNNSGATGSPHLTSGSTNLTTGQHTVEVRYSLAVGFGILECWWTPPGGVRQLFVTPALSPPGPAIWRPTGPPPLQPPPVPASFAPPNSQ